MHNYSYQVHIEESIMLDMFIIEKKNEFLSSIEPTVAKKSTYDLSYDIKFYKNIASLHYILYVDSGGAHSIRYDKVFYYDLINNKELFLEDLITSKDEFLSFFDDISEELPKTYNFEFDQLSDITVNTTYYGDKESATTTVQKMDGKVDFAYDFTTKGDYYFRHLTDALLSDGKSKEIRQYQGFYTKTSENGYIGVNISGSQVTENEISEENLVEMVDAIIGGSIVGLGDQFKLNDEFFEELIKYYFMNSEPEFYINSQTKKATIKGYMDFDSSLITQDTNNYTKLSGDLLMQVDEFGMINNYTIDGVINTLNKYETSSTDSHGTLVVSLVGASNENIEHTSVEPLE